MIRKILGAFAAIICAGAIAWAVPSGTLPPFWNIPFAAIGGSAYVSLATRMGWTLTPQDFGAKGDGQFTSFKASCTSGSAIVDFATNGSYPAPAFSATDVGKVIAVPGCGGAYMAGATPTLAAGGSGYVYGEIVTLSGGVGSESMQMLVTKTGAADTISAGAIVTAVLYNPGIYSTAPTGVMSQSATSKAGTGATFNAPAFNSVLSASISSVNSATEVVLSATATVTQSATAQWVVWGHDDAPAFNAAIAQMIPSKVFAGAGLHVPPAASTCYLIGSQITLLGYSGPTGYDPQNSVRLHGDGPASTICAGAPMDAMIGFSGSFNRGYVVDNLNLFGSAMVVHNWNSGAAFGDIHVHDVWFQAAALGGENVLLAGGENFFDRNYIANMQPFYPSLASLPTFGMSITAPDSSINENIIFNAAVAQIYNASPDNHFNQNHGYGYPLAYVAPTNFIDAGGSTWTANSADTATANGFYVTGYGSHLVGNRAFSNGVTMPIGIEIASGVQDVLVESNWADESTVTKAVVQDGSPGVNNTVWGNSGGATQPPFANLNYNLFQGFGNTYPVAGQFGPSGFTGVYSTMAGKWSFGFGNGVNDQYRQGCFIHATGANARQGDAQSLDCVEYGQGTSGTVYITASGSVAPIQTTIIRTRIDIPGGEDVTVNLHAFCSTLDYADWTVNFGLLANKSAASVLFEGPTGSTTTPPTWTTVRASAGASTWVPAVVLDTTRGGAYLTGSGTCTGGKTIYWTANVHIVETGAGTN